MPRALLGRTTSLPCRLGWRLVGIIGYRSGLIAVNRTRAIWPSLPVKDFTGPGTVDACSSQFTATISMDTVSRYFTALVPRDHWWATTSGRPAGFGRFLT